MPGIYVLLDFHPYLTDPIHIRMLKDIAQGYEQVARTLVLISHEVTLPEELEGFATRLQLALPSVGERQMIVKRVAQEWSKANRGHTAVIEPEALTKLVDNLCGHSPGSARARQARRGFLGSRIGTGDCRGALQRARQRSPRHCRRHCAGVEDNQTVVGCDGREDRDLARLGA